MSCDRPSWLLQSLTFQPFAYNIASLNTEAPCRVSKAVGLIAKLLNSTFHINPILNSAEVPQFVKHICSPHLLATSSFIIMMISVLDSCLPPHHHPPTLFLHCNQPDNSTFMTYSLHKQTQFLTAAQQMLLKYFLAQLPLQFSQLTFWYS